MYLAIIIATVCLLRMHAATPFKLVYVVTNVTNLHKHWFTIACIYCRISSIVSISSTTEQDGKTVSSAGQIYCNSGAV